MSLPTTWIDRIFEKLSLVYGRQFVARWEGLSIADVKTDWGHELARFHERPECIAWALKNLPVDKPPTVLQFRELCMSAPQADTKLLPEPKADPELVAQMLSEIQRTRSRVAQDTPKADPKEWARKLLARHESGDIRPAACVAMAKAALNARQEQAHEL